MAVGHAPARERAVRGGDAVAGTTKARAAAIVFGAVMLVAVPIYVTRDGGQWFFLDDWDFLADRSVTAGDLFRPHNEHWSTLPILAYRFLWRVVGINQYWPYQALIIALHLVAAVLLRAVMRRALVDPWIATAAASVFVLLGSGRQNIVWSFQIGFVGALVFGLVHLLLADHDGPLDRRDAIGLGVGVLGLMCSGVAVTMTVVVGIAALIRRGWRVAAFHTAPLAALFGIWWLAYARDEYDAATNSIGPVFEFVRTGIANAFGRIGQVPGVGAALAVLLVGGLILAWGRLPLATLRQRAAAPAALLIGALLVMVIAAVGRVDQLGSDSAKATRYVHLVAAMMLPALAVAADTVIRRWRWSIAIVVALLLVGIPGNIDAFEPTGIQRFTLGDRPGVLALPASPYAHDVPRSLRPLGIGGPEVTMRWLLDGAAAGRIPDPPKMSAAEQGAVSLGIILQQEATDIATEGCPTVAAPVDLHMERGDALVYSGGSILVELLTGGTSDALTYQDRADVFSPRQPQRLEALAGPIDVRVRSAPGQRVVACT